MAKDMVSEMERAQNSERMRTFHKYKRARGEHVGVAPPFGWAKGPDGKTLVEVPEKQEIIKEMIRQYVAGRTGTEIAQWLNEKGVITPCGHIGAFRRHGWIQKKVERVLIRNGITIRPRRKKSARQLFFDEARIKSLQVSRFPDDPGEGD